METDHLIKKSLKVSLASFLFGTSLLMLFFFTNWYFFALVSLPLILVLGIANLIQFSRLIQKALRDKANRKRIFSTCGVVSVNIPVVFLYAYFVFVLADSVIVRFKNDTGKTLTNVRVVGCDESVVQNLLPGEVEIEWIPITTACTEKSILLRYEIDGVAIEEVVYGYVIDGRRINHTIGDQEKRVTADK
ncbi:MAG TPA: hypothetical protein VGK59_05535 [Ohtaekwangia sp.]